MVSRGAHLPTLSSAKFMLREAALTGPSLDYLGGYSLILAWTGIDTLHHLNLATIDPQERGVYAPKS